jgi:hypothetical protein
VDNDRGLGHVGGGFEYRFTPHIGILGEAGYNWVGGGRHNFKFLSEELCTDQFRFQIRLLEEKTRFGLQSRLSGRGEVIVHGCGAAVIHLDRGSATCPSGDKWARSPNAG